MNAKQDRAARRALLGKLGIDERPLYDALRTTGVLLLEAGADLQQVKDQLGHSQIATTSRYYLHFTDRPAQDSAQRLGEALFVE